jgi:integrase
VHLDTSEQIQALLDAAGELDHDPYWRTNDRRPIIATLILAGPRAHELCNLLWRDVDLANGRLHIGRSKTQAGLREIPLLPLLRDELAAHKAASYRSGPDDPVFPTGTGGHRDKDNLRNRILAAAITRTDQLLLQREQLPLPAGITPHKLRHTFASILVALGHDPASVMAALGHTDPKFTLRIYTHLMRRDPEERARLKALVDGHTLEARLRAVVPRHPDSAIATP